MSSVAPVMKPSYSDARNSTARATSAGVPARPRGICWMVAWALAGRGVGVVESRAEDQAGRDGIDADAFRRKLVGQGAGPREHGALGRGIDQRPGMAALAARPGRTD